MSSKERRSVPAEAIEIYNKYIHDEISRREFMRGVKKFAVAGLSAGAIVEALMPNYALGQQISRDDERITTSYETIPSPDGNGYIRGYLVRPFSADSRRETPSKLPGIVVDSEIEGRQFASGEIAAAPVRLRVARGALAGGGHDIRLKLQAVDRDDLVVEEKARFLAPVPRR